jgi:SulP family sulfate permease
VGKTIHVRFLSEDCRALIDKAEAIIEVNHFDDPTYKVVRNLE